MAVTAIRQIVNEEDNEEVLIIVTVSPITPNILYYSVLILVKNLRLSFVVF